jgi:hypothetical protein
MSEVRVSDPRIVLCAHCMEVEKMIGPPNVDYVDATVEWDHGDGDRGSYTFTNPETGLVMQVPETDPVMEDFVGRHQHGREPKDVIESIHVWTTDMATFVKMDVMQVVKEGLQKQQNMVVEETNGLKDDALKCYNAHGNPDLKKGCRDFRDDSKRIGTSKLPKEQQVHLCLFCPYAQTYIAQELRWKVGAYGNPVRRRRKTVDTNVSIGPRAAAALGGKGGNRRARRKKR